MTKRDIINDILDANPSSDPGFLAEFSDADLMGYLHRLHDRLVPTMIGNADRFADHFRHTDSTMVEDELSVHEHVEPVIVAQPAEETTVTHGVRVQHDLEMDISRRYFEPDGPDGNDPCAETMEFEPITIEEPSIDVIPPQLAGIEAEFTALAGQYRSDPVDAEHQPLVYTTNTQPTFDDDDSEAWLF
jgi:hypothetical protein